MAEIAHPPETLEGWYVLHQIFTLERAALQSIAPAELPALKARATAELRDLISNPPDGGGWTGLFPLIGSRADLMLVHFRATLEGLADAQRQVKSLAIADAMIPEYSFLSITEAALYHISAELAKRATERGGIPGDEAYRTEMDDRAAAERRSAHVQRRLYPERPPDMPYVCFYPMSKRRDALQNWYTLPIDVRSQLMHTHGLTGRRYAGRIMQVISGAIGFDAWEWGVTLFAKDPLEFKKIVTDMRFDEVSAKYAEFGEFFVGKVGEPAELVGAL
jgi:hydrogen peroxide-dependent heme synthase